MINISILLIKLLDNVHKNVKFIIYWLINNVLFIYHKQYNKSNQENNINYYTIFYKKSF